VTHTDATTRRPRLYASQIAPVSWHNRTALFGASGAMLVTIAPSSNRSAAAPPHSTPAARSRANPIAASTIS
jgi:hypothetical protein